MSLDSLTPIGRRHGDFIRGNLNYLLDFPDLNDGEWVVRKQPPGVAARINELNSRRFIEKQGRASQYPTTFRYTTNPHAYDAIQAEADRRSTLPCGHTGVTTIRVDEAYGCGYEFCDETYPRDVVEEVFES